MSEALLDLMQEPVVVVDRAFDSVECPLDLGRARFIPHTPPDMLRPWDGSRWGSYTPPR